jgi:hypothetical protein
MAMNISYRELTNIPKEFSGKIVRQDFWCDRNKLVCLNNSPKIVYGSFDCFCNQLFNLDVFPLIIIRIALF